MKELKHNYVIFEVHYKYFPTYDQTLDKTAYLNKIFDARKLKVWLSYYVHIHMHFKIHNLNKH